MDTITEAPATLVAAAAAPTTVDFSFVTDFVAANVPIILVAVGVIMAAGLVIGLTIWGGGKLPGLLKKTAK